MDLAAPENQLFLVNGLILVLNTSLLIWLWMRYRHVTNHVREFDTEYEKLLLDARKNSSQLISTAEHKAERVISHAELETRVLEGAFQKQVHDLQDTYLKKMEQDFVTLGKDYAGFWESYKEQAKKDMNTRVGGVWVNEEKAIRDSLEDWRTKTKQIEKLYEQHFKERMIEVDAEIERYKKSVIDSVSTRADMLVKTSLRRVLERDLSDDLQEKVILELLQKAKKEGVFDEK